jgi:hypothetical protein
VSWPREDDVRRWLGLMDERIAQANDTYSRVVLPEEQRRQEAKDKAAAEYQERLEGARKQIEDL